jgi:hypothetical protein
MDNDAPGALEEIASCHRLKPIGAGHKASEAAGNDKSSPLAALVTPLGRRDSSAQKFAHIGGDLWAVRLEREMTCIDHVNFYSG